MSDSGGGGNDGNYHRLSPNISTDKSNDVSESFLYVNEHSPYHQENNLSESKSEDDSLGTSNEPLVGPNDSSSERRLILPCDREDSRYLCGIWHQKGALFSMSVLIGINLLNYIDRYVPSAAKKDIKQDFGINNAETSLPLTTFILVYMCCSPIFGYLADRGWSRRWLICTGVVSWSIFTAAAALCHSYAAFLIVRSLVGVGEAAYSTLAPAMISDWYPKQDRSKMMAVFYTGIPVGAALGFGIGALVSNSFGWRVAFTVVGIPGIVLAFSILFTTDPERGQMDDPAEYKLKHAQKHLNNWEVLKCLASNKVFVVLVVGVSLTTFALGGMSDWFPTYMQEVLGLDEDDAGLYAGATTFFGGLFGTIFGGYLAERMVTRVKNSYLALSGWSVLIAAVLSTVIIALDGPVGVIVFLLFITQFCLWASVGPSNALAANVVPPLHRARAFGVLVFFQHAFGDAASPTILGLISDATSLRFAACLIPLMWYLAGTVFVVASRFLDEVHLRRLEEEVEEIAEVL